MLETTLGQRIKELRLAAGLAMRELGTFVNVSAPHIADIEQGNRQPSDELLARLAEALKTSLDDLGRFSKRPPAKEMERLIEQDQSYSLAFRKFVDAVRDKGVPPEAIIDLSKKLHKTK
jgi:transcriptional regulator with XRE-family HTH domain